MREIKFRAWDKKQNIFIPCHSGLITIISYANSGFDYPVLSFDSKVNKELQNIEIMQYTGLKDKNGKEIYERDIVEQYHYYNNFGKVDEDYYQIGEVKWWQPEDEPRSPRYMVYYSVKHPNGYVSNTKEEFVIPGRIKVIGNIYDNPELLNLVK